MTLKGIAGTGHAPTIENCATECTYDSQLYIKDGLYIDKDFEALKQNSLIQDFANVSDETYALVAQTNPMLKTFFDVCKDIVSEEAGHE